MTKAEEGIWSVTVGPVEPNLYPYHFIVDGTSVADPSNQELFPNENFKASLVDIPSNLPSLHSAQSVPHGEMSYAFYESKKLNCIRPLVIYTPPGYRKGTDHYPVLFLVSGTTDTEETWFRVGRVNYILDNLIAQQRAVPMIVVMPYGNMLMGMPRPDTPQADVMYQAFSDELVSNILPYVESNYRVVARRESRAIAGFSRGGGQSMFTAFSHPDKFAWIASYSAYLMPEAFERHFSHLLADPEASRRQTRLFWLGVGKDDFLYARAEAFHTFLEKKNLDHRLLVTEGGHTWMNARQYLTETLQLFFKQ